MSAQKKRTAPEEPKLSPAQITSPGSANIVPAGQSSMAGHPSRTVDCKLSGQKLWLVKVPKSLSDIWEQADDETVALLQVMKSRSDGEIEMRMKLSDELRDDQASEYKVVLKKLNFNEPSSAASTKEPIKMAVFSESLKNEDVMMQGYVTNRADIRPVGSDTSVHLQSQKVQNEIGPARTIQFFKDPVINFKPVADRVEHVKEMKPVKKLRDEKDVVSRSILAAFEKSQYISIKDLVDITQQPVSYLKEIVLEYCVKSTKSSHKNMWELKPEFRHY